MTTPDPETLRQVADRIESVLEKDPDPESVERLDQLDGIACMYLPAHPITGIDGVCNVLPFEQQDWWLRAAIAALRSEAAMGHEHIWLNVHQLGETLPAGSVCTQCGAWVADAGRKLQET